MQLICLGDVAVTQDLPSWPGWAPPGGVTLDDDVRVLFNMELPLGSQLNPRPRIRGPRLLSKPEMVEKIKNWSPGFAALGTNHILDGGETGLANTLAVLQREGFVTVGAGMMPEDIDRPLFWETKQGKLAIVNWVFPETHPDWMAVPGPNCWPGIEEAIKQIHDLKKDANWVMVLAHWSDEDFSYPRPEDRLIAREMADAGLDLLVCHHPHVVRGYETIGSCQVFYSLGNYFFSDHKALKGGWTARQAPRNRESIGLSISFLRDMRPSVQVLSFWQQKEETVPDKFHRAAKRMELVSRPLRSFPDAKYTDWYTNKRARFTRGEYQIHFRLWKLGVHGLRDYLMEKIRRKKLLDRFM